MKETAERDFVTVTTGVLYNQTVAVVAITGKYARGSKHRKESTGQ